jgi:hypothetical protein
VSALANRWPARYEQLFAWTFPCENLLIRLSPLKESFKVAVDREARIARSSTGE